MNKEDFIKNLYHSVIKENSTIYWDLFTNTDINKVKDSYWKEALKLYTDLSDENKDVLFKIIEQVQVDAVSNILGVLDGTTSIEAEDVEFKLITEDNDKQINGDLQDLFLEYDEENR